MRALNKRDRVGILGVFMFLLAAWSAAPAAEAQPITVAILDFEDRGPSIDLAPLRNALAEMLLGDLSQYQGVRVVERFRVDQLLRERNLQQGFTDAATAAKIGQALAAEYLLAGSFAAKADTVSVEALLFKTGETQARAVWKESVPAVRLGELEHGLAEKILAAVGIGKPVRRAPPQPKRGPSPPVAVLGFKNLSPSSRLDAMQSGFAEALQGHLSAVGYVRLVERERLHAVLKEQKLTLAGLTDPQTAIRVGKLLGAERLIYGSFVELGRTLRLDLRLVDTQTAAVLRAEAASGATDHFTALLEDLALRLAADLAIAPPAGAANRVKGATTTRNLEAAVHLAQADQLSHMGRYAEAAKRYERVLLLEPKHPYAAVQRGWAWLEAHEYPRAIDVGEQVLAAGIVAPGSDLKVRLYSLLHIGHAELHHRDRVLELDGLRNAEFPASGYVGSRAWMTASALCNAGRRDEAVAMLENAVEEQKAKGDLRRYADALQTLHTFYFYGGGVKWRGEHGERILSKQTAALWKQSVQRSLDLYDRIIDEAEKTPRSMWKTWAENRAIQSIDPVYYDDKGVSRALGTGFKAKESRLVRLLRVFPEYHEIAWKGRLMLAELREKDGNWHGAVEAHRAVIEEVQFIDRQPLPDPWDCRMVTRQSGLDEAIRAQWRIADIFRRHLSDPPKAREAYRRLIEEFGLAHDWGIQTASGLHAVSGSSPSLGRAAIVWGGGDWAWKAWNGLLRPMGYRVHRLAQYHLSTAHLAPYSLVILVRTGNLPYSPEDVLALRNYVAAGGSLLAVVSPGWLHAQPGIHNPLLSFFSVRAGHEMTVRATSARIADHPITKGSGKVLAKNAIHLNAPPESVLVQASDRNVLVAMPYRQGRVVIASLGQWFLPDPAFPITRPPRVGLLWTSDVPPADLPMEIGGTLHLPLLRNVLAWLAEPSGDEEAAQQRKLWTEAMAKSLQAQFRIIPRHELLQTLDHLVDEAKPGLWKEEALWAAGEASLNLVYTDYGSSAHYGPSERDTPIQPKTAYYERLVREFPESPLCPYAKWRHADCKRREVNNASPEWWNAYRVRGKPEETAAFFTTIDVPKDSYAWAWTELRLGVSRFQAKNPQEALEHFRKVAESFDPGPEKAMAVLNAALCHEKLGNRAEVIRLCQAARTLPDIRFQSYGYEDWAPLGPGGRSGNGIRLNEYAEDWLQALGMLKKSPH